MDIRSIEGYKTHKLVDFSYRRSFDSFKEFDRAKRNSMTPGSCPSASQKNLKEQVDMFGFGDEFDDHDYFSLNTPVVSSDLLQTRESSLKSIVNHRPPKAKRARK